MTLIHRKVRDTVAGIVGILLLVVVAFVTNSQGQVQATPPGSFDMTGLAQKLSVNSPCSTSPALCGGTLTINGVTITIPDNTVVQMPATDMGWGEMFQRNPTPNGIESGLALADLTKVSPGTYEFHVQGNIINSRYIAGLVFISQEVANQGQGFIDHVDYQNGEMLIADGMGGLLRLQINDPAARFSIGRTPDNRFTIDEDNPTVRSVTGFPMCLPRTDPTVINPVTGLPTDDQLCPQLNRPLDPTQPGGFDVNFTMASPGAGPTDPTRMAPLERGDFLTYQGVLHTDSRGNYISAYQVIANVAIYTAPGTDPAYIAIDVLLQGTGGSPTNPIPLEVTTKVKVEGFTTDPTRTVDITALDTDCNGIVTERVWASQFITDAAVKGRFRFRPNGGLFLPPAREVHVYISSPLGRAQQLPVANGLISGQYHAPDFAFIFPENIPLGGALALANFEDFPWLVNGIGPRNGGAFVVGQLNPWPGLTPPPTSCTFVPPGQAVPPVAVASSNLSTATVGQTVTLNSTGTTGLNLTFQWAQTGGPQMTLSGATSPTASFVVPSTVTAPTSVTFLLTVSNSAGSSTAPVSVALNPPAPPVPPPVPVASATPNPVLSGGFVNLIGSNSSDPQGNLPLTFNWIQTSGTLVTLSDPTAANPTFTAPTVILPSQTQTLGFTLAVTNSAAKTASTSVAVKVTNIPDVVTITAATYVVAKTKFTVTATDSIVSTAIKIRCTDDAINPATGKPFTGVMGNLGNGNYSISFSGGKVPTTVTCSSNDGGSATSTNIVLK